MMFGAHHHSFSIPVCSTLQPSGLFKVTFQAGQAHCLVIEVCAVVAWTFFWVGGVPSEGH